MNDPLRDFADKPDDYYDLLDDAAEAEAGPLLARIEALLPGLVEPKAARRQELDDPALLTLSSFARE